MNIKVKVHTEESYSVIQCNSSAEKSDDCIEVGKSSSDDYRPLTTKPSDSNLSSSSRRVKTNIEKIAKNIKILSKVLGKTSALLSEQNNIISGTQRIDTSTQVKQVHYT
jgi:hypothetical protein